MESSAWEAAERQSSSLQNEHLRTKSMRILEIISSVNPAGGGPIEGIKQLAAFNTARGHHVELASLDAPDSFFLKTLNIPVHSLGPALGSYSYSSRFVPWLRQNAASYDVVVVNGLWQYSSFGTWRALRGTSTPYVVFTHGMLDPWFRRQYPLKHLKKCLYWPWAEYRALRDAQAVLFTCEEEQRLVRKSFSPFPDNGVVVGYGTAGPKGDALAEREAFLERLPELRGKRLAVFLGRLHPKKGCDLLIQAFAEVLAKDPAWRLVMAGPDQVGWQSELMAMAKKLKVSDRITWTGMIDGDARWGALRAAEVLVLPSHSENFAVVVPEALACGVPVLISNRVNIWREIEKDGAGLVDSDDLEGTRRLFARWLSLDDAGREALRQRTRPCFQKRFEIHCVANNLIDVLDRVTKKNTVKA
jgi:glycosyltransferase involved in cell wall biosynthesis